MFPLFETICVFNGHILHSTWHEKRFKSAYMRLFRKEPFFSLLEGVIVPNSCKIGKYKLRIQYNELTKDVDFSLYVAKPINSLKIVCDDSVMYDLKYTDRVALHHLLRQKESCDDILIEQGGNLSDTSFSNIVFFDGKDWLTPFTPLLNGTTRQRLLGTGKIKEKVIRRVDLKRFKSFQIINAMRDLNEYDAVPVNQIF